MTLTAEQRRRLNRDGFVPVVIDGVACVVLRVDVYDRIRPALHPSETPIMDRWDTEGDGIDVDDYVS